MTSRDLGAAIDPAPRGQRHGHPSSAAIMGLLVLMAITVVAVLPGLGGAYTFDEDAGVAANRAIRPGAPLRDALLYRFSPDQARPLFFLSLWLDARWHGMAPRGFRVTNLLLHLACGIVVFGLLRRVAAGRGAPGHATGPADGAALAGTALFLLHPLQSESVIYIWGRSGILAALFSLLALLVAPRPGEPRHGRPPGGEHSGRAAVVSSPRAWLAACLLLALGLAAKEEAIVLPLVALLWWLLVEGVPGRAALSGAACLAIPVALFVSLRIGVLGAAGRQVYVRSVADNILGQGVVGLRMLALTLWPAGQSVDHAAAVPAAAPGLAAVGACLALVGAALAGALLVRHPGLRTTCAGALVYAAGMSIYWLVPLPDLMSERRAYLPLFGAALALAGIVTTATCTAEAGRRPVERRTLRATLLPALLPALVVAVLLAPALRARSRLWSDPALLWEEAARRAPAKARPHINLGVMAAERNDRDIAAARFDRAVALEPRNPEALYNRGRLRLDAGDVAGAEADLAAAVAADPTVPRAHVNLAVALIRQGHLAQAEDHLRLALAIDPGEPRALTNLAEILRETGRTAEALPLYRRALASDPGYAHAAARLGVALEQQGDREGALAAYHLYLERGAASESDAAAVRARIAALEAALAAPGSIR